MVTLSIYCDRDCKKSYDALPANARPTDWQDYWTSGAFTYLLSFYGVEFFEIKNEKSSMEYLNGRFKDTQIVRELNANSKRPYYHFRIQITDGYIDIVFNKFKIRKTVGRVNYSAKGFIFGDEPSPIPLRAGSVWPQPSVADIDETDDFDRFFTMQRRYRDGDPALAAYARECLKSELPVVDAKPYAAYVLGKVGKKSDLELIKPVYFQAKNELQKRHILDAIEILEAL